MDQAEISAAERSSNRIIEQQLDERSTALANAMSADVLSYNGSLDVYTPDEIKEAVEAISPKRRKLVVVLETPGGYIDVAERVATILRHHYREVDYLVPSFAMSAGTVLVMSGDEIHMDYASVLGPIDPQIPMGQGGLVPALGYLVQYERLIDKSRDGTMTTAELTFLIENFNPAELYQYEQEVQLSIALLEEWLVRFKFKNWKATEGRGVKVTPKMRKERAKEIAEGLNDTARWHSHSRGIPAEVLRRDLKLQIADFGAFPHLSSVVHNYHRLLKDYMMRRTHFLFVVHTEGRYVGY